MVATYEDIEAAKKQLAQAEESALQAQRQKIPERKYGAGYDVQAYQRQILANKLLAEQNLQSIARSRAELATIQAQREQQEAEAETIAKEQQEWEQAQQAVAETSGSLGGFYTKYLPPGARRKAEQIIADRQAAEEAQKQLIKAKEDLLAWQRQHPTEELLFNEKTGQLVGVKSGALNQTRALVTPVQLENYNQALAKVGVGRAPMFAAPPQNELMRKITEKYQQKVQMQDIERVKKIGQSRYDTFISQVKQSPRDVLTRLGTVGTPLAQIIGERVFGYEPQSKQLQEINKLQEEQNANVESFNRLVASGKISPEEAQDKSINLQNNQYLIDQRTSSLSAERAASTFGKFMSIEQQTSSFLKKAFVATNPQLAMIGKYIDPKLEKLTEGRPIGILYSGTKAFAREFIEHPLGEAIVFGASLGVGTAIRGGRTGIKVFRTLAAGGEEVVESGFLKRASAIINVGKYTGGILLAGKLITDVANAPTTQEAGEILGRGLATGVVIGGGFTAGTRLGGIIERPIFEPVKEYNLTPPSIIVQREILQQYVPTKDITLGRFDTFAIQFPTTIIKKSRLDIAAIKVQEALKRFSPFKKYEPELTSYEKNIYKGRTIEGTGRVTLLSTEPFFVKKGRVFSLAAYIMRGRLAPVKVFSFSQGEYFTRYLQTIEGGIEDKDVIAGIIGKRGLERLRLALGESKAGVPISEDFLKTIKDEEAFGAMKLTRVGQIAKGDRINRFLLKSETFALRSFIKELPKKEEGIIRLKGETAFFDTTFPNIRPSKEGTLELFAPRKIPIVKSITKIKEQTLVEEYGDILSPPSKLTTQQVQSKAINIKAMKQFQDLTTKDLVKPRPLTPTQRAQINKITQFKPSPQVSQTPSAFAGLGLYERTEGGLLPKESVKVISRETTSLVPRELTREVVRTVPRQVPRQTTKSIVREVPREIVREVVRIVPKEIVRETVRVVSRQITRQVTRQITRVELSPFAPRPTRAAPRPTPFVISTKKERDILAREGRYILEVRRAGKFRARARTESLQQAVNIGEDIVKRNLAATFRIRGAQQGEQAVVDFGRFRLPKYPGREAPFTFVQRRRGRGGRLASYGENVEIQMARATARKKR